jgi:hypothetical protein
VNAGRGAVGGEAVFRARNLPQAGAASDLFGLWEPVSPGGAGPGEIDFGLAEDEADELHWTIDLPWDPRRAAAGLDTGEARLDTLLLDLHDAERRLAGFVVGGGPPAAGEAAYDIDDGSSLAATGRSPVAGDAALLGEPEADLHGLLEEIARVGEPAARDPGQPVAFDGVEPAAGRLQETREGFEGFLRQFYRTVSHYAWVETAVHGRLVGRTRVTWLGDADTTWRTPVTAEQIALHQRAVTLALNTRAAMMRVAVLVIQGARLLAQLPVMLTPIGILMTIPAAWRFLDKVLAEARRLRGLPESSR